MFLFMDTFSFSVINKGKILNNYKIVLILESFLQKESVMVYFLHECIETKS